MTKPEFVYVTYIASSPGKVWEALTEPRVTSKFWHHENVSDWKAGSKWEHRQSDSERALRLVGKVVESVPPRRLVITWAFPADAKNEGKHTRVTFEIEEVKGLVRLTVTHDRLEASPAMAGPISIGWPKVLSSLKSLLETGKPLPELW